MMFEEFSYQDYVTDESFLKQYNDYQSRYATKMRESDKVIVSMVHSIVEQAGDRRLRVLDIGCSTGNLLLHLKRLIPDADYTGGDLAQSSLEVCRSNPDLADVSFEVLDITHLAPDSFNIIVVNAVLYMFDDDQYNKAITSLHSALTNKGSLIVYDFAHPFTQQNLIIYETTLWHPDGLRLCFRQKNFIHKTLKKAGFEKIDFYPFELPIELPKPGYDENVVTYTVNTETEGRLMFRGALYQPWCHMIAKKP